MDEEYGQEEYDYDAMLQPFQDAFAALGEEKVDRWALKEIFEALGNQINSEEEFEQQFLDIDTDGDGLITFEDFKRMIMSLNDSPNDADADFYIVQDDDPSKPPTLSADALSLLNNLFENQKRLDGKIYVLDLKKVKTQLESQTSQKEKMQVPLEVFNRFFGSFLKQKSQITQQEFSDLISEAENRLFAIGEAADSSDAKIQQPKVQPQAPMKLGQQKQETPQPQKQIEQPKLKKQESDLLTGSEYASRTRQDSVRMIREEQTSLFAYTINELSVHTEKPEVQLNDVVQVLIEAGTFEEFKPKDWTVFFKIFSKKYAEVTERIQSLQDDQEGSKSMLKAVESEKQDLINEINQLREENQMALDQNDELTRANNEMSSYLSVFEETRKSEARLREYLNQSQNQMADLRAQLYSSQRNEKELADSIQEYVDQLSEMRIELQSAKQIILQEGNENMKLRQETVRQSMMVKRQSMAQQPFASSALQGLRESTVGFGKRSQEETDLLSQSADMTQSYMKALQDAAKNGKLSETERKGMLTIAQQFERYKKAYESVKLEKDQLEEEQLKILQGLEKLDKQANERKRQINKDRKEIEKLKTKLEQSTQQKEELMQLINQLRVEIQMVNQGVIRKVQEAPATVTAGAQPKSSLFIKKREITNRSTDVAGIVKRFGAKPVAPVQPEIKEMTMEDELGQEFGDLPRIGDGSFQFNEQRPGQLVTRETQGQDGDFGSYINGIRDSRVSNFGFVVPQAQSAGKTTQNSDYVEFGDRMSTWNAGPSQSIMREARPSVNQTQAQGFNLPQRKQAPRKLSVGNQFRPTMLNQVKEDDEEDDGRSTVQNENGFELEDEFNENDQTFENFDAEDRFSNIERHTDGRGRQSQASATEQRFQSIAQIREQSSSEKLRERDESQAIEQSKEEQASKWQEELEMLKFELEKQRVDNFILREQMSDALEKEKQNAEQNYLKELDQIKALHQIEKESIEQSNQKAIADLQTHLQMLKQANQQAEPIPSEDLEQEGDDQIKQLNVLLKDLDQKTITKAQFIQKAKIQFSDPQPQLQATEVTMADQAQEDEVEIDNESNSSDIIAVPPEEEEFTPEVEYQQDSNQLPIVFPTSQQIENTKQETQESLKQTLVVSNPEIYSAMVGQNSDIVADLASKITAQNDNAQKAAKDHFLEVHDRDEDEDGQTMVGTIDSKIKIDRTQERDTRIQERETTHVEEQRFSQGLKFGRKPAKTQKKESNESRADFYEETGFRNFEEDTDSDEEQFYMPNLQNRKTKAPVVSSDARETIQQSSFISEAQPKKSAWTKSSSNQASASKEVSNFSEIEMQFKDDDLDANHIVIDEEDSDDEEERNDQVQELNTGLKLKLADSQLSDSMFDGTLPKIGQTEKKQFNPQVQDKIRMSVKDQLAVEQRVGKVQALLMRSSQNNRMSVRKSVINATSNQKDFDYLFLTKPTNESMYKPIMKLLNTYGESGNTAVFSEYIQSFNPELKVTEYILLCNHKSLYLLDKKGGYKHRHDLPKLRQIIMIKTNPCIFALSFGGLSTPLLLQSFRRSELIMFLLSQVKSNVPKVVVTRSSGIRIFLQDKNSKQTIQKVIKFDKISKKGENSQMSKDLIKQLEKNVQLNNFANAINSGYLKMRTSTFLIGTRWEERFVVLTNIGLLYFADPHQAPLDLFPVLDCEIVKVHPSEVKGNECTFKLVYLTKNVTFQCSNGAELANWLLQIQKLQKVTLEVRDRLKQEEVRRMTMLMGQL